MPDYPGEWVEDLGHLRDQIDTLGPRSPAGEVAAVWISILATWFPPFEGYQIRPASTGRWVDVYVIRIARAPEETDVSVNPVFVIRCFDPTTWNNFFVDLNNIWDSFPIMIRAYCTRVLMAILPAHGALAFQNRVHFVEFDADVRNMSTAGNMRDTYTLRLDGPIPSHLDEVKAEFVAQWGTPYSEY